MANGQRRGVTEVERATTREIRAWMARRGVQQRELAEALGYTQSAISLRMSGKTAFTLRDLAQIAERLDVTLVQLLGQVGTAQLVRGDEGTEEAPSPSGEEASRLAPPTGLEPVTLRLNDSLLGRAWGWRFCARHLHMTPRHHRAHCEETPND